MLLKQRDLGTIAEESHALQHQKIDESQKESDKAP